MKRLMFMILSGIVVVLAVTGVFMYMKMDTYAKTAIEKYASAILGTKVTVGKVNLSPASGEGSVDDLVIGNPHGFSTPHALMMNSTHVKVDMKSLPTEDVVIDEVVLDNPDIVYEVGAHGNNFAVLRTNANDYLSKGERTATEGLVGSKHVLVKDFYLRNGKVKVIAPSLQNQSFIVSLPTIHLSDLGKGQGKGNLPQIMEQVSSVITNTVVSSVGNVTLENFVKFLPNTVSGVVHGVVNDTGTAIQDMGQGIGEMFGGKK